MRRVHTLDNNIDARAFPALPGEGLISSLFILSGDLVAVRTQGRHRSAYILHHDAAAWAEMRIN